MESNPIRIFISYCNKDEIWVKSEEKLHDLIPFLKRSICCQENSKSEKVIFWFDSNKENGIEPGEEYKNVIFSELNKADIAILLISQEFLNSEFIRKYELKIIEQKHNKKQLDILPILLEPCELEEIEFINSMQLVPGKQDSLLDYTENEKSWIIVRRDILKALKKKIEKISINKIRNIKENDFLNLSKENKIENNQEIILNKTQIIRILEDRIERAIELNALQRAKSKILKARINYESLKEIEGIYVFSGKFTAENQLRIFFFNYPFNYTGKFKGKTYDCKSLKLRELSFTSFWERIRCISWVDVRHDLIEQSNKEIHNS
jgi:hypothetical protein